MHPTVASLALLLAAGGAPAQEVTVDPEAGFVQVSGTADVSVPADRAHVLFAVETEAQDARSAVRMNAASMEAVIAALRGSGVEGLDLETSGFDLQPQYERGPGEVTRIRAYRAQNHVSVTLDDVEAVGRVIDAATEAGANRVASLRFEARETDQPRLEALRLATEDARQQAEILAATLGLPLGPPLEVHVSSQRTPPVAFAGMEMAMRAGPATPVEAGDQTVSASVTIKYRLGGAPDGG